MNATPADPFQADRALVEAALDRCIPAATARPAALHAAIRHSLFAGGKRIRPILVLASARACGAATDDPALPAALAIECLHTYTLIHDDLPCMDDDTLRRGRPTCHVVYGEATALLAGDALQAIAFGLAAQSPVRPAEIVRELARAAGSEGVVAGQVEDMEAERAADPDPEKLDYIETHKTGDLFLCACRMGAHAAGASPGQLDALSAYAHAIGRAFQIADDILNATSTPEVLGKAVGTDAARGKTTAVSLLGLDGARARLQTLTDEAVAALAPLDPARRAPLADLAVRLLRRTA